MNLPAYFLADLESSAALTPVIVRDACLAVKSNRRQFLLERNTDAIVGTLAALAEDWLDPGNPFRQLALARGPAQLGFSTETLAAGLDAYFRRLTAAELRALLRQDLGHEQRLDRLVPPAGEACPDRAAIAHGPELLVQVTAGRLPNATLTGIVLGLLVRSAQFIKCASGTSLIPRLFAHSLREIEPKLSSCLEIAEWKGGHHELESALFAEADCVRAMGNDDTIDSLRRHVPGQARFLGYGHRVSFGYVTREALTAGNLTRLTDACAADVAAWDQLGCLSPHVIYVETGSRQSPLKFAETLAAALANRERLEPRGGLSVADAAHIASRRGFYEVRAANSNDTALWSSPGSTAWTVVYENEPRFQLSCLNRFVYVKAIADVEQALAGVDAVRGKVSTVGVAAAGLRQQELAHRFARWGITRVCPLGEMQQPPLTWRHDGRPELGELVTWTDWETGARF